MLVYGAKGFEGLKGLMMFMKAGQNFFKKLLCSTQNLPMFSKQAPYSVLIVVFVHC
jgi:hypothetical protein